MRLFSRSLPGLLLVVLACGSTSPPDFGSTERFNEDVVVGNFISQRLDEAHQDPSQPEPWIRLGMTFETNDYLAEAVLAYEYALRLEGGNTARTWYRLGNTYGALGRPADALEAFNTSAEADPEYEATFWRRGEVHLTLGNNDAAREDFERALETDAAQFPALLGLAKVLLQSDREDDAERAVELVQPIADRFPNMRRARHLLGLALRRLGRLEEAREHLEAGARGATSDQTSGQSLAFGRYVRDPWQRELKEVRVSHRMVLALARQAFMSGDMEGAANTLEELRAHRPDDVTLGLNLANVYRESKRTNEAITLLEGLLDRHPQRFHIAMDLAWCLHQEGREDDALAMADRAAAIDPLHNGPSLLRGRVAGTIPEPPPAPPRTPNLQPVMIQVETP